MAFEENTYDGQRVRQVIRLLEEILAFLKSNVNHTVSFTIAQQPQGDSTMLPIAPGFSPVFTATPLPIGAFPAPGNLPVWSSSDTVNAPIASVDPTGLVATVAVPAGASVGASFTLGVSYTNADGTVATGSASFTIVAPPPPDITGFSIAQSV